MFETLRVFIEPKTHVKMLTSAGYTSRTETCIEALVVGSGLVYITGNIIETQQPEGISGGARCGFVVYSTTLIFGMCFLTENLSLISTSCPQNVHAIRYNNGKIPALEKGVI